MRNTKQGTCQPQARALLGRVEVLHWFILHAHAWFADDLTDQTASEAARRAR